MLAESIRVANAIKLSLICKDKMPGAISYH